MTPQHHFGLCPKMCSNENTYCCLLWTLFCKKRIADSYWQPLSAKNDIICCKLIYNSIYMGLKRALGFNLLEPSKASIIEILLQRSHELYELAGIFSLIMSALQSPQQLHV